ncbi:MAG: hypothetical protein N2504_01845 [candidate division WOR-3 bacterium]|nr:hypothetical protein [candidate division WOR-3 bacterium]
MNLAFSLTIELENAMYQNSKNFFLIEKNDSIVNLFIKNFTRTYKKPSIPTLIEIRDSIYKLNQNQKTYAKLSDTLKIQDIAKSISNQKLHDIHIIYLLSYISYNFNLNFDVYCVVKYSKTFKDAMLFDLTLLYGNSMYGCYPLLVIDNYHIIGPRKIYVLNRVSDFERFPDELFSKEIPELNAQMKGYKVKLIKGNKN